MPMQAKENPKKEAMSYENVSGSYFKCFNNSFTLEETIKHMREHHSDTQSVERIKVMFQKLNSNPRLNKAIAFRNKMNKEMPNPPNRAPTLPTLKDSYKKCFDNFFTLDEMINYMANRHIEPEHRVRGVFEKLLVEKYGDSDYQDVAKERSLERMMLIQANEWSNNQKKSVLQDRLSILPDKARALVKALSNEDKYVLCFFISKEFVNREGDPAYVLTEAHETCFHCHCFECFYHFSVRLDSSTNSFLIQQIMSHFDDEETEEPSKRLGQGKKVDQKKNKKKKTVGGKRR